MANWRLWGGLWVSLAMGCGTGGATADGGVDASTPATGGCPTQSEIAFNAAVRGSTGAGWGSNLTSWFAQSNVACVPATMSASYPAPFAVFSLPQPRTTDWDVVVTPDSGVDVNVIAWQQSATDASCFPSRGIGVVTCEAGGRAGAGGAESVRLQATTNPYRVVILVTTPQGATRGGFSIVVRNHS